MRRSRVAPGAAKVSYGEDPDQFGEWLPPAGDFTSRPPVATALLLHGGYYRSRWRLDLMRPLATDLSLRGWAVFNAEYRRPDAHGWAATHADVHAALAAVGGIPSFPADRPLVVVGHSAGGQLALQLAEESVGGFASSGPAPRIALAVSLAGVVDLPGAFARNSSAGAVAMALGGSPADQPARYSAASPSLFAARSVPWLLVQGTDDDAADFVAPNRALSTDARLGHPELLERPGDHFAVIDPAAPIWHATVARVDTLLGLAAADTEP